MAAPKGDKALDRMFDDVITDIAENGTSAIAALKKVKMSTATFYKLLRDDEKLKRYARATEMRAEVMAEEILTIADNTGGDIITLPDGREVTNHEVVNRDRLRVDARKWLLAKLQPKKYGDKIDVTSGNEPITAVNVTYVDKSDRDRSE
jgi:hypothetical protein